MKPKDTSLTADGVSQNSGERHQRGKVGRCGNHRRKGILWWAEDERVAPTNGKSCDRRAAPQDWKNGMEMFLEKGTDQFLSFLTERPRTQDR